MADNVNSSLTSIGSVVKLLPTGTFFLFQFLSPILTNNGKCDITNKYLTGFFLVFCCLCTCFSWFTDSYTDKNGVTRYGIATWKGLVPFSDPNASSMDLTCYKLVFGDFVHALLSMLVFDVLVLLQSNIVCCFYPSFVTNDALIMVLPPFVGTICSTAFVMFPNNRYGIGHLRGSEKKSQSKSKSEAKSDSESDTNTTPLLDRKDEGAGSSV